MTYDSFVDTVLEQLSSHDREIVSKIATVVWETFSEILHRSERDKLSAPLPKALDHRIHAAKPENTREEVERLTGEAFLDRVKARADLNREEALSATKAVLSTLQEAVGDAMLSDLGGSLPPSYAEIFPFMEAQRADLDVLSPISRPSNPDLFPRNPPDNPGKSVLGEVSSSPNRDEKTILHSSSGP